MRGWSWISNNITSAFGFGIIQPITGTSPTASVQNDTLTFTSSDSSIQVIGNSGTKTIDLKVGTLSAPGSNMQVIFNDAGAFGADSDLTYNKTTNVLTSGSFQVGTAYPVKTGSVGNEIIIGPTTPSTGNGDSIFIGNSAGDLASNMTQTVFIGPSAGAGATYSGIGPIDFQSVFIGLGAGASSTDAYDCLFIGTQAGGGSNGSSNTGIGNNSFGASTVTASFGMGQYVFEFASGADNVGIGNYSFNFSSATESTGVGANTFANASNVVQSLAFGRFAGQNSSGSNSNTWVGPSSGANSVNLAYSAALGISALAGATQSDYPIAVGYFTLANAAACTDTIAIGGFAGSGDLFYPDNSGSIMIGKNSGFEALYSRDCIFIGLHSGFQDTVDNVTTQGWNIAIGRYSGTGGFQNSIAIGNGAINSATAQANVGNVIYIDGIKISDTPDATSETAAHVGFCTNTPTATLDVEGDNKLGIGGTIFQNLVSATATLDFPSIGSNSTAELTMTVTGATVGASVHVGAPDTIEAGLTFCGYVSAADTVAIRVHNASGGSLNPASATWRATVINF